MKLTMLFKITIQFCLIILIKFWFFDLIITLLYLNPFILLSIIEVLWNFKWALLTYATALIWSLLNHIRIFEIILFTLTAWTWMPFLIYKFLNFCLFNIRYLIQVLKIHMWHIAPRACDWTSFLDFIDSTLRVLDLRPMIFIESGVRNVDYI